MPKVVSDRAGEFYTSGSAIRRMFEEGIRLRSIHGADKVCDLSIGNPQFNPPAAFLAALRKVAAAEGSHSYMQNAGYPEVRESVAEYLNAHGYFEDIQKDHIVMTTGAAGALNIVLETILDRGEEVIVLRPCFIEYRFYVDAHGGVLRFADTDADFGLDVAAIERAINSKTRAVIINSPNNPTGRIYPRKSLEDLADMLERVSTRRNDPVFLISDEPYREIIFDGNQYVSPASMCANSFMCYSWSKSFSIAGERIGYLAVNPEMAVDSWQKLMGSLGMCNRYLGFVNAPALIQRVIGESIDAPVEISHYREKRRLLRAALRESDYHFADPEGTFYFFVRTPEPEAQFIDRARRHLLLVVPGTDFGRDGYFRISYSAPLQTIELACLKLKAIAREISSTDKASSI